MSHSSRIPMCSEMFLRIKNFLKFSIVSNQLSVYSSEAQAVVFIWLPPLFLRICCCPSCWTETKCIVALALGGFNYWLRGCSVLDAVPVKDPHRGSLKFLFVSPGREREFNYSFFSLLSYDRIFVLCRNLFIYLSLQWFHFTFCVSSS